MWTEKTLVLNDLLLMNGWLFKLSLGSRSLHHRYGLICFWRHGHFLLENRKGLTLGPDQLVFLFEIFEQLVEVQSDWSMLITGACGLLTNQTSAAFARAAAVAYPLQGFAILGTATVSCVSVSWKNMNGNKLLAPFFQETLH